MPFPPCFIAPRVRLAGVGVDGPGSPTVVNVGIGCMLSGFGFCLSGVADGEELARDEHW